LIIWNVGQGQWISWITDKECWHADMGGEFAPWREIQFRCRQKPNVIALSHWDSDHINFIGRIPRALPDSCLLYPPEGVSSPRKQKMLRRVKICDQIVSPFSTWAQDPSNRHLTSNDTSRILLWQSVLTPGDSSKHSESIWANHLTGIENTRILLLGHHGSRTSTGDVLLSKLPKLIIAIASARY
jgi:competence protein ComEC